MVYNPALMTSITKHPFSWLLILALALAPIRIGMAYGFDQNINASDCVKLHMQLSPADVIQGSGPCDQGQNKHCVSLQSCTASQLSTSMQFKTSFHEPIRVVINFHFQKNSDSLFRFYPDPLKRPPMA